MLVSLGIAIPVVAYFKKKIAARHFTINYRIAVADYIQWTKPLRGIRVRHIHSL